MLALHHLLCVAISLVVRLGRRRIRGAFALAARLIRIGVFVGAARNVAPLGGVDRFFAVSVFFTHDPLLDAFSDWGADGMPRAYIAM